MIASTGALGLVTVIFPLVAVAGTTAISLPGSALVSTLAATPLNFTVEVDRNPSPVIVTSVPVGPLAG